MLDSKKREGYENNNSLIDLAGLISDVKEEEIILHSKLMMALQ